MGQALRRATCRLHRPPPPPPPHPPPESMANKLERPSPVLPSAEAREAPAAFQDQVGVPGPDNNSNVKDETGVLEERDPGYDAMLSKMVGRITSKPGGKLEMGERMTKTDNTGTSRASRSSDNQIDQLLVMLENQQERYEAQQLQAEARSMAQQRQLDSLTQLVIALATNNSASGTAATPVTAAVALRETGLVEADEPQQATKRSSFKGTEFLKLNPPEFEGRTTPDKVMDWIVKMEGLFEFAEVPANKRVACAVIQLRLRAHDWWQVKKHDLATKYPDGRITWRMFKEAFLEQYLPPAVRQMKEDEFLELTQGSMSVEDYESEFSKLAKFAGSMIPNETARMHRFVRGLNDDLRKDVMNRECESYIKAFEAAIQNEQFKPRSAPEKVSANRNPPAKRYHDGEKKVGAEKHYGQQCTYCGRRDHTIANCRTKNRECFNCGQKGHSFKDCQHKRHVPKNRNHSAEPEQNQNLVLITNNRHNEQLRRPRVYNLALGREDVFHDGFHSREVQPTYAKTSEFKSRYWC